MPRMNYTEEYAATQAAINQFHQACQLSHSHGWAYEAGWLQSALARVLMALPRKQREQELAGIVRHTREMEARVIVRSLIE